MSSTVLHLVTAAARRGAEVHAVELDRELSALGHRSSVAALHAGPATLPVEALGPSSLSRRTLLEVRRRARRADVVVAHGARTLPASAIALVGAGVPFVYRSIGDPEAWVTGAAARRRTGVFLRRAARVVALWPEAAARLTELHRLDPSRVRVVPNAVRRPDRPLVAPPGDGTIAYVGSLSEEKRPRLALDVAHRLGRPMVVAGDGPLRPSLESLASGRDQAVRFLGSVDDVTSVYDRADVLLLTSRTEGQPAVLLEAAQRGRPVVATAVGGVPAMVRDGVEGRLVPPSAGSDEVATAVGEVLGRAQDMGTAAREGLGRRGDVAVLARDWSTLLDELVARRR